MRHRGLRSNDQDMDWSMHEPTFMLPGFHAPSTPQLLLFDSQLLAQSVQIWIHHVFNHMHIEHGGSSHSYVSLPEGISAMFIEYVATKMITDSLVGPRPLLTS